MINKETMTTSQKQTEILKLNDEMFNRLDKLDGQGLSVLNHRILSKKIFNEIGEKVNNILSL